MMKRSALVLSIFASSVFAASVQAQGIPPDCDCWVTDPGTTVRIPTLPADFFGPGSDPFISTVIPVEGNPGPIAGAAAALCPANQEMTTVWVDPHGTPVAPDDMHAVRQEIVGPDTIVCRLEAANFSGGVGVPDTIDIELVELSLVSSDPIVVTFNAGGGVSSYDVFITETAIVPGGSMRLTPNSIGPTGGSTGIAEVPDMPIEYELTFVKVQGANGAPNLVLPNLNTNMGNSPIHGQNPGSFTYTAPIIGGIPALGPIGMVAMLSCLLVLGVLVLRRRAAVAS